LFLSPPPPPLSRPPARWSKRSIEFPLQSWPQDPRSLFAYGDLPFVLRWPPFPRLKLQRNSPSAFSLSVPPPPCLNKSVTGCQLINVFFSLFVEFTPARTRFFLSCRFLPQPHCDPFPSLGIGPPFSPAPDRNGCGLGWKSLGALSILCGRSLHLPLSPPSAYLFLLDYFLLPFSAPPGFYVRLPFPISRNTSLVLFAPLYD